MLNRYEYSIRGSLLFNIDFISRPLNFVYLFIYLFFLTNTAPVFLVVSSERSYKKDKRKSMCLLLLLLLLLLLALYTG